MHSSNLVPSFYFYKLADALSSPYTSLAAYSAGIIDSAGNIKKPESSIDAFEYLVIKLKKIIDQLPYGMTKAQLGNYFSTLRMFSEEIEQFDISQEQYHCLIEGIVTHQSNGSASYLELLEDMATGGGAGALGVPAEGGNINQGGVSGFDPPLGMPLQRRKQPKYFDTCEVFEVCPEEFLQLKAAKTWKDVPDGDTKNYLQRFQRRNKGGKIAVKSLNPLNAEHELHWINYPAKNFLGENRGDEHFNAAANAILKPFVKNNRIDIEKVNQIHSGKITQTDAEEYGRLAMFVSSLGNLNKKTTTPFLDKTITTSQKKVSDTSEDGVGVDDDGRMYYGNAKNGRATFGTRGVESVGFPEQIIKSFYSAKQEKQGASSEREIKKIQQTMSKLRGQAKEWAEPPSRQKALRGLITKHLDVQKQPVVAVTPWENPLLIPHEGVVRHIMNQPVRVVLGLMGEKNRPEPQSQLTGSELARTPSGMSKLKTNIALQPRHLVPDEKDISVAKDRIHPEIFKNLMKVVKG